MDTGNSDLELLHAAFANGDLTAFRLAMKDPAYFPNLTFGCGDTCLDYALYHAPHDDAAPLQQALRHGQMAGAAAMQVA
ncbi:MAG TPA: hypothetical protein VIT92_17110 [Burkholderiaceae bacterium]